MDTLSDFPFTGDRRPFDWHLTEPVPEDKPTHYLTSKNEIEAYADLKICLYLYMFNRRSCYVNYMAGAKNLFAIFFPPEHCLKEMAAAWNKDVTEAIAFRPPVIKDWPPQYEIQRLWLATKIHWSWLELAWMECEVEIFKSGQAWMIKALDRASPLL